MRKLWLVPVMIAALALAACAPVKKTPPTGSATFDCVDGVDVDFGLQQFTVPAGVTSVTIQALGGEGGTAFSGGVGGLGADARGTFAVTPGDTLVAFVGCEGGDATSASGPGDGQGGGGDATNGGGGGGGAASVFGSGVAIAAAGGGGGGHTGGPGGDGGGTTGEPGENGLDSTGGGGGTQTGGGTAGTSAGGGPAQKGEFLDGGFGGSHGGGGGGAGLFGGGGGGGNSAGAAAGGGGGSSFAPTVDPGVHSGDGQIVITW